MEVDGSGRIGQVNWHMPYPERDARWATTPAWQVWVDTGGSFTDAVAVAPDGSMRRAKALSSRDRRGTTVYVGERGADRPTRHPVASGSWMPFYPRGLRGVLRRIDERAAGAAGLVLRRDQHA